MPHLYGVIRGSLQISIWLRHFLEQIKFQRMVALEYIVIKLTIRIVNFTFYMFFITMVLLSQIKLEILLSYMCCLEEDTYDTQLIILKLGTLPL